MLFLTSPVTDKNTYLVEATTEQQGTRRPFGTLTVMDLIVLWLKSASKIIPMKLYIIQCIALQCDKSEEWLFCGGGEGKCGRD